MKSCTLPLLASALVLLSASCATDDKKKKDEPETKPKVEGPKLVGRIASVPADKRFVLIQGYGKWELAAGAIVTTRGTDDRLANLRITGEKLGEFAAADVQSGTLEKGDAVYVQHAPKPVLTLPTTPPAADSPVELPQSEPPAPDENVQKNN